MVEPFREMALVDTASSPLEFPARTKWIMESHHSEIMEKVEVLGRAKKQQVKWIETITSQETLDNRDETALSAKDRECSYSI